MSGRAKKPKPVTLIQEAEAYGFEIDNLLTTELSAQLTAKGELKRGRELIKRLVSRVKATEGLIDGYALNCRRGSQGAMREALDAMKRDSEARFPAWRRRRVA